MQLEITEIKNLLAIISRPTTVIQGDEVQTVAALQTKLASLIPKEVVTEETK